MATMPDIASLDAGLPANIDAEKTILGAILLDNTAHSEAAERLEPDDFSLDSHKRIFVRMSELMNEQHDVDIVTLSNELARVKEIEAVGGVAYLASLTEGLPMRPVIEEYIRIVKDKSLLRKLMLICSAAIARAADQSETALEVIGAAETALLEVSEKGVTGGLEPLEHIVANSFGNIDNLYRNSRTVTGLETDFTKLDEMTSGLQKGELIIVAARPSMGKTAFAINMAQNAAVNHNATVAVFSLEMKKRVAAATHAFVAGMGRSAQPADRFHPQGRSRQAGARAGSAGGIAIVHRRYRRYFAGGDARKGTAAEADLRGT